MKIMEKQKYGIILKIDPFCSKKCDTPPFWIFFPQKYILQISQLLSHNHFRALYLTKYKNREKNNFTVVFNFLHRTFF